MDEFNENDIRKASTAPSSRPLTKEEEDLLQEADEQFIGSYTHTVDAKGRIVVPAPFRAMLGGTFFIAPSHDFRSVALYSKLSWSKTRHRYASLDPLNNDVALLLEQFNALSYSGQECDGQGRVLLPPRIRQLLLGEEKELEISGAGDHVNITTVTMAAEKFQQVMKGMPEIMKTINLLRARELNGGRTVLIDRREE